jgi:hypothetical protein
MSERSAGNLAGRTNAARDDHGPDMEDRLDPFAAVWATEGHS